MSKNCIKTLLPKRLIYLKVQVWSSSEEYLVTLGTLKVHWKLYCNVCLHLLKYKNFVNDDGLVFYAPFNII